MTSKPLSYPSTFPLLALFAAWHASCAEPSPAGPSRGTEVSALEGRWEGDGDSGEVQLTIAGDSLYFYARDDFQYDTTFVHVPNTDPAELEATILDTPRTTDSQGETVVAIYELDGDELRLAAIDRVEGEPASFDNVISRYRLKRVETGG